MGYVDLALTAQMVQALRRYWGIELPGPVERLFGGEESAVFRVSEHAVRIGPVWRSDAELQWSYSIAGLIAARVPEVTAPVSRLDRGYLFRVGGHPVSVWPYVAGTWADCESENQRRQAAGLLARIHRACSALPPFGARPAAPGPGKVSEPLLHDPNLDLWMDRFYAEHQRVHPLHGDFYRGNILVRDGGIVALVDWDDVFIGPPEQELAWAAWEWRQERHRKLDIEGPLRFMQHYRAAGGTADLISLESYAQLVRDRIRMEVTYSQATGVWGTSADPDDVAYEAGLLHSFEALGSLI